MAPFTKFEVRIDERWWNRLIVGYEQGPMSTTRRKTLNRYARRFIESAISEKIEREKEK